jgi:hypothetical protein
LKTHEGVDVEVHIFLTSPVLGVEGSNSRPGSFTPQYRVVAETGGEKVERREIVSILAHEFRPLDYAFLAIENQYRANE